MDVSDLENCKKESSAFKQDEKAEEESSVQRNNLEECVFKYQSMLNDSKGKYGVNDSLKHRILDLCDDIIDNIEVRILVLGFGLTFQQFLSHMCRSLCKTLEHYIMDYTPRFMCFGVNTQVEGESLCMLIITASSRVVGP